jgi:O-antigen/teichoic acid export membrane protein
MQGMFSRFRSLPGLRGGFSRGVATLVTGTGIGQVVVVLVAPILTRLYQPTDFGAYAVAVAVLTLLLTFTCLRYEIAIPIPSSDQTAANLVALALLAAVGMSALSAVVLFLIGPWLIGLLGAPGLAPYVMILPLGQFGAAVGMAFTGWALRTRTFGAIATSRVTQGIVLAGTQVVLGLARLGSAGLLIGDTIGRSAGSARLAWAGWRRDAALFRQVSWSGIVAAATRYRRFPLVTTWSAFLAALGQQAPLLLMVAAYGVEVGGQYALAARIAALPLSLVAAAISQVFVAESANLARTGPSEVRYLFNRTTKVLALAGLLPALLVMLLAPPLAGVVFGSEWAAVGIYLAILAPSFYLEFVAGATGDILFILERQGLHLAREVFRFVLIGGAIPLAAVLGLSDVGAIVMLSAARCLTYGIYAVVSWRAVRQFTGPRRKPTAAPLPERAPAAADAITREELE